MSGFTVSKDTGSLSFTPRIKKRPPTPTAAQLLPQNNPAVPAGIAEPASAISSSDQLPTSLAKVNGHVSVHASTAAQTAAQTVVDWTALAERPLWRYFVKIRTLYFTQKPGEDTPLAKRYSAIKRFLFRKYLPDVLKVALSYKRKRMPQSSLTDLEDLEQAGCKKHWDLLDKYDPDFGDGNVTYMGYANANKASGVQGAMTDELRKMQEYPRGIPPLRRRLKPIVQGIQAQLQHRPTKEDILDQIGWQKRNRKLICDPLLDTGVFNQSQVSSEGNDSEAWESEILQLCEARPELKDRRLIKRENMDKILAPLSDKPEIRFIIFSYHFCHTNFDKVAKELRKAYGKRRSSSWIHAKYNEGLEILKQHFSREDFKEMTRE